MITRDEFRSRLENYAKACCVWETARSEGRSLIQADQGIRKSHAALLAAFDQLAANAEQLGHSTAVTPTPYERARDRIAEHKNIERSIWAFRNPRINTKRLEALRLRYWQLEDMSCDIASDLGDIESERVNDEARKRYYAADF